MRAQACETTARRAGSGRQTGFTLVEVMLAAVVMVVGLLGLMAVFPRAYQTTKESGRVTVLNHLAAEKIEELRSLAYDHSDLSIGVHPNKVADGSQYYYPVSGFPKDYSLRWTVSAGPTNGSGSAEPDMKTIVVESTFWVRYTVWGVRITGGQGVQTVLRTCISS